MTPSEIDKMIKDGGGCVSLTASSVALKRILELEAEVERLQECEHQMRADYESAVQTIADREELIEHWRGKHDQLHVKLQQVREIKDAAVTLADLQKEVIAKLEGSKP